jgi:hypothetical protein
MQNCVNDLSRCVTRVSDLISASVGKFTGNSNSSPVIPQPFPGPSPEASNLYRLTRNGSSIGTILATARSAAGIGYLATRTRTNDTLQRQAIKHVEGTGKSMITLTAGGFTNVAGSPKGLTYQDGRVVNAALGPAHALVIITKDSSVRVANLTDEFRLPGIEKPLSPRNRLIDYYNLTGWLKNQASAFQTYLLPQGDQLLLDQGKVPSTSTERRFFGAIRDINSGQLHMVLVKIPASSDLFTAAHGTFKFLSNINGKPKKLSFWYI